jgi:alanine racemase
MRDFLKRILKPKYEALNRIEIIGGNLIANYNYLKSQQPQAVIFPVLKSNAYGHGLKEVCRILNTTDAPLVAVDSYPEAQIVYRYFKGKVLLLGEMPLGAYKYCKLARTEFVVYNEATLKHLARYGKKAKVHLFINSGMNREGIKDLNSFIVKNKNYLIKVEVTGLCSHLASAEENSLLNKEQEDKFIAALDILHAAGFFPRWIHLGNSAAIFKLNNKLLTAYRAGLAFYGYGSSVDAKKEKQLKPALNIFSHLIAIQELETGEAVSYNETYRASQPTKIGVIPFGYFEGLDRRLSNQAQFSVQGYQGIFSAKIAGRICMNLTCLEISNNKAEIGAEVQIVSANSQDYNSIANLAVLSQTIPYEFLVKLQTNIRREIV